LARVYLPPELIHIQRQIEKPGDNSEGWYKPERSEVWHYFRNNRSLCMPSWYYHGGDLKEKPEGKTCSICKRKLLETGMIIPV